MYNELLECKQEVVLIPAPEQTHSEHKIRVCQNRPPKWFTEFVNQYQKVSKTYPKARPKVYRKEVLNALLALNRGENKTINSNRLLQFINKKISDEIDEIPF